MLNAGLEDSGDLEYLTPPADVTVNVVVPEPANISQPVKPMGSVLRVLNNTIRELNSEYKILKNRDSVSKNDIVVWNALWGDEFISADINQFTDMRTKTLIPLICSNFEYRIQSVWDTIKEKITEAKEHELNKDRLKAALVGLADFKRDYGSFDFSNKNLIIYHEDRLMDVSTIPLRSLGSAELTKDGRIIVYVSEQDISHLSEVVSGHPVGSFIRHVVDVGCQESIRGLWDFLMSSKIESTFQLDITKLVNETIGCNGISDISDRLLQINTYSESMVDTALSDIMYGINRLDEANDLIEGINSTLVGMSLLMAFLQIFVA